MSVHPHADTPEALHTLFERFHRDGDLDGLLSLYEPDALLVLEGAEMRDRDAHRAAFEGFLAAGLQLTWRTRSVHLQGDLALLAADWRLHPPDDLEGGTSGVSGEVARRQPDGRWRYVMDVPGFAST